MEDNSNPAMIVAFMVCAASGGLMGLLAGYVIWG
jgi:coenzyme F420-reducing hydrogenase gamma subunit